jgi:hypothetical protein
MISTHTKALVHQISKRSSSRYPKEKKNFLKFFYFHL